MPHKAFKRFGFTLAEVLITLTIVGIVAAMTIPTLLGRYQNKVNEVQLKKAVSIIGNNLAMMKAEHGSNFAEERYPAESFAQDFAKNIRSLDYGDSYNMSCRYGKTPGGYNNPAGTGFNCQDRMGNGYVKTDNFIFLFHTSYAASYDFLLIFADINGGEKGPNRIGFDTFYFGLSPKNFATTNAYYTAPCRTVEELESNPSKCNCDFTNTSAYNDGAGCTAIALNDPKYWNYIKKFR